jgi:hypothetical protein
MKYYACFDGTMKIKVLNEIGLENRCSYEKASNTYSSLPLFDTIEDCIRDLNSYTKPVILPDGNEVIPDMFNYPHLADNYILKPVLFPVLGY